ncbi:hypothetical protein MVUOKPPV_CDS0045 [Klebsiella phage phi1_175008]|uniref:Uncharacterized protein n=2 Tax=Klebsiella phage phi1_175008 TaxID=3127744 RepID=A0ACD5FQY6_9CAUD
MSIIVIIIAVLVIFGAAKYSLIAVLIAGMVLGLILPRLMK